jgi:hypothetical protein
VRPVLFKGKCILKNILKFCSVSEFTTGFALILIPSIVTELIFSTTADGLTLIVGRFCGIILISFGFACWPGQNFNQSLRAMTLYNLLVTVFFTYIGLNTSSVGILLWPVAILHFGLAVLLIHDLFAGKNKTR